MKKSSTIDIDFKGAGAEINISNRNLRERAQMMLQANIKLNQVLGVSILGRLVLGLNVLVIAVLLIGYGVPP